ncbi:hypothetical protein CTAYLR_006925 [Chrysophaeum taylorii]|uniref:Hexosyltransferase n=1 Tax=Chrysophaeum taylorii TaxID=2483200 RepID=A0AAD7UBJ4_9STRA|nr:hypothetical protein CTAYLR_006925 [Chrysophaeum taylorii]
MWFWLLASRCAADIALARNWRQEHCVGETRLKDTIVTVATDATNQLPIVAVLNSTSSNAAKAGDISFVVITRHVRRLQHVVHRFLPQIAVTVCGGFSELLMQRPALSKLMSLRNSTRVKRKELLSPFNFAAFYLPYVLHDSPRARVLYLDTDTVVKGDVGDLDDLDMRGAPAAAVEDCTQKIFKYINFEMLRKYDQRAPEKQAWKRWGLADTLSNETCVFNRGVVLFDCARWRELRLTETIEDLVDAFVESRARLWRGGISQPPFLLTLAGRYLKLDLEWNVRGLGRMDLGRREWLQLAEYARHRYGSEPNVFERHMAPSGPFRQTFNPFLCPIAAFAKILHFNGEFKPWTLSSAAIDSWRFLGLNVSHAREIVGTCEIRACPTSVNVSTGRRLRSACESWHHFTTSETTTLPRWDQQHYSPDMLPWTTKPESVTDYYASGCIARPPLCTCSSVLSDDCVTICASHWHQFVNPTVMLDAAARGDPAWLASSLRVLHGRRHAPRRLLLKNSI